ncbi:hypothetical protein [Bacillus norwichensis]|uniref:Flagellar hook-length control protein FliK n=1 Tax=Bacillus norwichensis TaxID=2762217 RepID=A0ABR8VGV7_9BACI|nr:hypothetical protein [Bacillus norwichensis]MBD8004002.1 hypothetical protein [Bacillus norwichensis]
MDIQTLIQDLFQTLSSSQTQPLTLRNGQIFFAHVHRIFPNQHAEIQLGTHKLIARLEAPLESGKGYFLQVESVEGEPQLKLIGSKQADQFSLVRQLSLPNEKEYHALTEFFTKESLSLTREQIQQAGQWVGKAADKKLALDAIKLMSTRDMPFTESIFKSLVVVGSKQPLTEVISTLHMALGSEKDPDSTSQRIVALIDELGKESSQKGAIAEPFVWQGKTAMANIKHTIRQMGLFYEHAIIHDNETSAESLKALLIEYLGRPGTSLNPTARQAAEQLLHRMNGQQLISIDSGPIQQIFFDLPIELNGHRTELSFQWEGKRREDGKIDPDYCRVIFYLNMQNLDQTVVDVKIQNRIMNITVINTHSPEIKVLAPMLIPALKEKLKEHGYELSAVHFKPPVSQKNKQSQTLSPRPYSGVDIQI